MGTSSNSESEFGRLRKFDAKRIDECRHTTTLSVILFGDLVPITLLLKYTVKEEKITSDTIMVCENIILPLSILPKHTTIIGRCTIYFGDCVPAIYRKRMNAE